MARKSLKREDDITSRVGEDVLEKLYVKVEKGFEEQRDRSDDILDNWGLYNCKLDDRQFYAGNTKIFIPFIRDAVNARVTRFSNQIFPQSGRYIEVTTGEVDTPEATQSLLESYVRQCKLRTQVVPALLRNGDMEGQYSIYVTWKERKRHAMFRVQKQPETNGMPNEAADAVEDIEEDIVVDRLPDVEVISDPDLLILPVTANSIEEALDVGGSVTVLRRWSEGKIKAMMADGDLREDVGEDLIDEMTKVREDDKRDLPQKHADAAGIKARGKYAMVYETWSNLKVGKEDRRLCRSFFGGEQRVLGCKLNPFWNDRCPVISHPVQKVAGVCKGQAPVAGGPSDLQILANDTINEGADTAHFSAMPIVMTDPLSNPRTDTMVMGLAALWEVDPNKTKIVEFPDLWRDCLERAMALQQQIFQSLSVNPAMLPQQTGKPGAKRNQAEAALETQVDILTTADAVTNLEEGILTPLAQRFAELDHQFRDEATTIRVYGEMGLRANVEMVEPIQLNKRFEFRWFGVEAARNAAQIQQQISTINVVMKLPPQTYPNYDLDISPVIVRLIENTFGPREGPLIFKRKTMISVDPATENEMMEEGFQTSVHPADDDMDHIMSHMAALRMNGQDPHGTFRDHIAQHQAQMQAKAMKEAATMQQGAPGAPGGGRGTPPGAQPAGPRQGKAPAGAMHPDQMAKAGVVQIPRKT
jgi:hypothetical protein